MEYREFIIEGKREDYEIFTALLARAGIDTYREESADLLDELEDAQKAWNYVDESVFDLEGDALRFYFYVPEEGDPDGMEEKIRARLKEIGRGKLTVNRVEDTDWANEWKKYYKPLAVGQHLHIVPSWEDYTPNKEDIVITMDPGMAFGSGTHETTWLCMEKLEEYVKEGDILLDIGCGSGILSVTGALLGAKKVIGTDIDPVAMKASKENACRNGVEKYCDFRLGNLMDVVDEKADIIVSNIVAEIIVTFLDDVAYSLRSGGIFISSGIIPEKMKPVTEGLKERGFQILEVSQKGEWVCVVGEKR